MNIIQKSLVLLGKDRRKLPGMVVVFILMSGIDVLGIGLMAPFMSLIMDPDLQISLAQFLENTFGRHIDERSAVLIVGLLLMLYFFLRFFLAIGVNSIIISFTEKQRLRLKLHLLKTYQSMSSQASNLRNSAEYIHAVHTMTGYYSGNVLFFILKFISETLICIAIIFLLAFQNLIVVLALLVLLLVVTIGWDTFSKARLKYLGAEINKHSGEALGFLRESLDGYEEIRILGKTEKFIKRFEINSAKLKKLQKSAAIYNSVPRYLLELTILLFVVFLATSSFIFTSNFTNFIPMMTVFAVAGVRLLPSATLLTHAIVVIRHNSNSVNSLYEDYLKSLGCRNEPSIEENPVNLDNFKELEINKLYFSFDKQSEYILKDVNLKIKAGDSIGIIGSSGSGKSTLASLIIGLLDPVKGSVLVDGANIAACKASWQKSLALIPQQVFLLDASIAANISLEFDEKKIDEVRLVSALKMASMKDYVESLPAGIMTEIGEKGVFLSGGQRQRLILARAFYHGRDFLVMDEATSALDMATEAKIIEEIMDLKKNVTVIMIAHRLSTLKNCDHIYEVKNGQVTHQ